MLKAVRTMLFVFGMMLLVAPAMAQEAAVDSPAAEVAAVEESAAPFSIPLLGSSLIVIGVAIGIGRIGGSAVESIARQPEYAGKIQTAMIIAAALIEGIGFAALLIGK